MVVLGLAVTRCRGEPDGSSLVRSVRTSLCLWCDSNAFGMPIPQMGQRGKFIILRPANGPRHQWLSESVDLASDFARMFGQQTPDVLAVAISSDSDDTRGRNRAQLRDLRVGD